MTVYNTYTHDRDTLQHSVIVEFIDQINAESVALFIGLAVFPDERARA